MKVDIRVVVCLLAGAALPALAQSPPVPVPLPVVQTQALQGQALTLQDAIAMGQRQGPAAQVARSARDAARDRDQRFNARLLPQVMLSGQAANLNHGINPITQPDGSTEFIGQAQNQSTLGLAVAQNIPLTGGQISIGSQVSRIDLFGDQNGRIYQTTPVLLSLQQDLFKPRELVWNERVQSLSATVAERGYFEAREDVAGTIAGAFFDFYAGQMTYDNEAANASVNDTLYTLNKGRFEVGKIGENELLNSELQLLRVARIGRRRQAHARSRGGGASPHDRVSRGPRALDRHAGLNSNHRRRSRRRRSRGAEELERHAAESSSTRRRRSARSPKRG